jgi:hypothetical protein
VLAAKCPLAIRLMDAHSDEMAEGMDTTIGYEGRAKAEARLRQLEGGSMMGAMNGNLKGGPNTIQSLPRPQQLHPPTTMAVIWLWMMLLQQRRCPRTRRKEKRKTTVQGW